MQVSQSFGITTSDLIFAAIDAAKKLHENPSLMAEIREFNRANRESSPQPQEQSNQMEFDWAEQPHEPKKNQSRKRSGSKKMAG
jgi:hypothetical protein